MSQVQSLNYSTHAIEDILKTIQTIKHRLPQSAATMKKLVQLLENSQKFIMPNCCDIFDPEIFQQSHMDLFRLPYPVTVFEAPWVTADQKPVTKVNDLLMTEFSTKRIALCVEASVDHPELEFIDGLNGILSKFPQGGGYIIPIFWTKNTGWEITNGGVFVPYDNSVTRMKSNEISEEEIAFKTMSEAGRLSQEFTKIQAEPFVLLPEFFQSYAHKIGIEQSFQQILVDCHDEISMATQACAVLNCQNIQTEVINPPAKLNKNRAKADKPPLFSYHVLQINEKSSQSSTGVNSGTHRSPRSHLRRGHIRRLKDKITWVRSSMVNTSSTDGKIAKEYKIN